MDSFFSNPKGYPKITKRVRDGDDENGGGLFPSKKQKVGEFDYMNVNRNGSGEDYMR